MRNGSRMSEIVDQVIGEAIHVLVTLCDWVFWPLGPIADAITAAIQWADRKPED